MPNLSALAPITTAATALSNLILVSPNAVIGYQPQNLPSDGNKPQPEAFVFQYEGDQSLTSECDIPDHYLEDNLAYQDQIAMKPLLYVTHGFIGELNDVTPDFLKPVKFIANKLTTIGAYEPQLTTTGLIAYQEAFFLYQVAQNAANSAVSAWATIANGGPIQNKQQLAFQKLYGYQQERRLFTVQTPWAVYQDMAIFKLRAIQDDSTNVITDFEVTFKAMRFAKTDIGPGNFLSNGVSKFQGQAAAQAAPLTNLGTSSPTSSTPLSSGISSITGG
jgi:hypothetical protein